MSHRQTAIPACLIAAVTFASLSFTSLLAPRIAIGDARCGHVAAETAAAPTGETPSITDALMVLQAAVGLRECEPCVCDVDASGSISVSDAGMVLRLAVGVPVELSCPTCASTVQSLGETTGGRWDPVSCGDYSCGFRPECAAVIPGGDCGVERVFVNKLGCRLSSECGVSERTLCEATGGTWDDCLCGSITCDGFPLCQACLGGCACNSTVQRFIGFDAEIGCVSCFHSF
jgi:hypothetical protein